MEDERHHGPADPPASWPPVGHPRGTRARVLLTSVFGPYAQDDEYGSRAINPMELYHNQVTRVEGPFSLRMFRRSWGLMLIQANLSAPCTLLDFPTLDRFVQEVRDHRYEIIGISSITTNLLKVRHMCELIRKHQPAAVIVVGGHIAKIAGLDKQIDADWVVRGEGVQWFRRFLGEEPNRPIGHTVIPTRIGTRCMGIAVQEKPADVAATRIPSVGCPVGCNFCATSAMFGGKGKCVDFYRTGDELFDIMLQIEQLRETQSFFVMDENFREFGWRSRLSALLGGPYVARKIRREEQRLAAGWTYEPPTFYEVNEAADPGQYPTALRCSYVTPQVAHRPAKSDDHSSTPVPGAFQGHSIGKPRRKDATVTSSARDSER